MAMTKEQTDILIVDTRATLVKGQSKAGKAIRDNSETLINDIEDELASITNFDGEYTDQNRAIELRNQLKLIQQANTGKKTPQESRGFFIEAASCLKRQVTWGNLGILVASVAAAVILGPIVAAALAFTPLGPILAIGLVAVGIYAAVKSLFHCFKSGFSKVTDSEEKNRQLAVKAIEAQLQAMPSTGTRTPINAPSNQSSEPSFSNRNFSKRPGNT